MAYPSRREPATIGTRQKHRLLSLMMMSHVLTERRTGQMSHGPWQSISFGCISKQNTGWLMLVFERHSDQNQWVYLILAMFGVYSICCCNFILTYKYTYNNIYIYIFFQIYRYMNAGRVDSWIPCFVGIRANLWQVYLGVVDVFFVSSWWVNLYLHDLKRGSHAGSESDKFTLGNPQKLAMTLFLVGPFHSCPRGPHLLSLLSNARTRFIPLPIWTSRFQQLRW